MKFLASLVAVLMAVILLSAGSARAQAGFGIEALAGAGGYEDLKGIALGGAISLIIGDKEEEGAPRVAIRPEVVWHHLEGGDDVFITGNVVIDIPLAEGAVVPGFMIGAGVDIFKADSSGFGLLGFFLPSSANGLAMNVGGSIKIYPVETLYFAPAFTFTRGFGDVEGNNYRVTGAVGVEFN